MLFLDVLSFDFLIREFFGILISIETERRIKIHHSGVKIHQGLSDHILEEAVVEQVVRVYGGYGVE